MILILTADGDLSCDLVIDFLIKKKHPFIRINSFDILNKDFFYDFEEKKIIIAQNIILLKDIKIVWYRKFGFFRSSDYYDEAKKIMHEDSIDLIEKEYYRILDAILYELKEKFWLTNPFSARLHKTNTLELAKKHGLQTPRTYLANRRIHLNDIKNELISKSIKDPIIIYKKKSNSIHAMFTSLIPIDEMKNIPNNFFCSLIQEKIDKVYELRVFYLLGIFYSMAIFSQNDPQTTIDFRKYNRTNPNRNVPYKLPKNIEIKLKNLLIDVDLNCASIDLIKDINGNYIFLEINPVGQFGMVDFPCNYGIHEKISNILIDYDKNEKISKQ